MLCLEFLTTVQGRLDALDAIDNGGCMMKQNHLFLGMESLKKCIGCLGNGNEYKFQGDNND